jgi:aspartate 1-decarboxylase
MRREVLYSKIHRATVTEANLHYVGSLSLCPALMEAAGLVEYEKVMVVNIANGARLWTYLMLGEAGEVCLNGAAARLGEPGDAVIVMAFCQLEAEELAAHRPRIVHVDGENRVVGEEGDAPHPV